jgi:HAD superfamily hydrolase (TIGR01509 family)
VNLRSRRHWIFDLDGTLTVPTHDFAAFRTVLGIPQGTGLLEWVASLPPAEGTVAEARIAAWEAEHAELAVAEADARALIAALHADGVVLGVLTRNRSDILWRTLEVAGLAAFFDRAACIGRDQAAAKPSPAGILLLLDAWGADPSDAVMVGDWGFDVEAGRSAGVATVLIDRDGSAARFGERADLHLRSLATLT